MQIELTKEEVEAVLNTLGQLPYNQSAGLIAKIHGQATEQAAAQNAEAMIEETKKLEKAK